MALEGGEVAATGGNHRQHRFGLPIGSNARESLAGNALAPVEQTGTHLFGLRAHGGAIERQQDLLAIHQRMANRESAGANRVLRAGKCLNALEGRSSAAQNWSGLRVHGPAAQQDAGDAHQK
ncbi:hypothetical protein ACFSX5_01240 [Devosia albogilva]|uniref:Uncharacterized protein n=1 Tax=Devosia albogilva TaxID=429726 RepID=A0ABW5QF28_9HYPH